MQGIGTQYPIVCDSKIKGSKFRKMKVEAFRVVNDKRYVKVLVR